MQNKISIDAQTLLFPIMFSYRYVPLYTMHASVFKPIIQQMLSLWRQQIYHYMVYCASLHVYQHVMVFVFSTSNILYNMNKCMNKHHFSKTNIVLSVFVSTSNCDVDAYHLIQYIRLFMNFAVTFIYTYILYLHVFLVNMP